MFKQECWFWCSWKFWVLTILRGEYQHRQQEFDKVWIRKGAEDDVLLLIQVWLPPPLHLKYSSLENIIMINNKNY